MLPRASRTVLTASMAYFLRGTLRKEKGEKRKNKKCPGFKHVLKPYLLSFVSLLSCPQRLCPPTFSWLCAWRKVRDEKAPPGGDIPGIGVLPCSPQMSGSHQTLLGATFGQWPVPGQVGLGAPSCSAHCSPPGPLASVVIGLWQEQGNEPS